MYQDSCAIFTYEFLRMLKRGGGCIPLSPSSIYNGINSNVSCEFHAGRKCFFFTSVGWSFYTPVTCIFKLRQRVQHFNYKLRIDINWFTNLIVVVTATEFFDFWYIMVFYFIDLTILILDQIELQRSSLRIWIAKDLLVHNQLLSYVCN